MRVRAEAATRYWAEVPAAFPAEAFADRDAWRHDIVERVRSARSAAGADLSAHEADAVEAIADAALDELAPGAAFGLLFLPWPDPVAALVHVEVGGKFGRGVGREIALQRAQFVRDGVAGEAKPFGFLFDVGLVDEVVSDIDAAGCDQHRTADGDTAGNGQTEDLKAHVPS